MVDSRRARSDGGLVLRGRLWRISWVDCRGRRRWESTGLTSRSAAAKVLRARLEEARLGRLPELRTVTLADLSKLVADDYRANGRRTTKHAERAFRRLIDNLGEDTPATRIGPATITTHVATRLAQGAARATVNRELAALRRGFRLAVRAGLVSARPDFELLAEHNARKGFLERDQLDSILARLPDWARPPVVAASETGWRVASELLTRQWRHVDLAAGWLRLDPGETKNGEGRMFPLTRGLRLALEAQEREAAEALRGDRMIPWVFHRQGEPIAPRALQDAWRVAARAAGLPAALLHDLRRTRVRDLERAHVPRSAAMALVGHRTASIYQRYAIVDELMLKEAAVLLDAASTGTEVAPSQRGQGGQGGQKP